jgi:hypothetical protein
MSFARRITYVIYRGYTGLAYRLRRRLTPAGWGLLIGIFTAGLLSLDVTTSLAYQALFFMLCCLAASALFALTFRGRFSVRRILPQFATVGVPMAYPLRVRNEGAGLQRGLALLEHLSDPRPSFPEFVDLQRADEQVLRAFRFSRSRVRWRFERARVGEAGVPDLAPGQEAEVGLRLTPVRRGLLRFNGATLARLDPLGLVRAHSTVASPQSLLVLPRRYPLPPITLPGAQRYQRGGVALASSVGESEEFVALRDYRQGDPLRRVHWRSWARVGRPIVKEYQDEFFVRHALVLDTFASPADDEVFEEAISTAASFACSISTQESLLDLLFVGTQAYCFTTGRGVAHTDQMLEVLAVVRPRGGKGFDALETLVLNHAGLISGCICILLAWDAPRQRLVSRLRMMGVPMLVLVIKERGGVDPVAGPMRDDPARFVVLEPGRVAEALSRLSDLAGP